jgi:hypothetical protein
LKKLLLILALVAAGLFAANLGVGRAPELALLGVLAIAVLMMIRAIGRTWFGAAVLLLLGLALFGLVARILNA